MLEDFQSRLLGSRTISAVFAYAEFIFFSLFESCLLALLTLF